MRDERGWWLGIASAGHGRFSGKAKLCDFGVTQRGVNARTTRFEDNRDGRRRRCRVIGSCNQTSQESLVHPLATKSATLVSSTARLRTGQPGLKMVVSSSPQSLRRAFLYAARSIGCHVAIRLTALGRATTMPCRMQEGPLQNMRPSPPFQPAFRAGIPEAGGPLAAKLLVRFGIRGAGSALPITSRVVAAGHQRSRRDKSMPGATQGALMSAKGNSPRKLPRISDIEERNMIFDPRSEWPRQENPALKDANKRAARLTSTLATCIGSASGHAGGSGCVCPVSPRGSSRPWRKPWVQNWRPRCCRLGRSHPGALRDINRVEHRRELGLCVDVDSLSVSLLTPESLPICVQFLLALSLRCSASSPLAMSNVSEGVSAFQELQ
jgi:hypothetical protein